MGPSDKGTGFIRQSAGAVLIFAFLIGLTFFAPAWLNMLALGATGLLAVGLMGVLERRSRPSFLNEKLVRVERERREAMAQLDLMEARSNRVELLGEAGVILASSMDLASTLRKVCDLLVMRLCDWCVIDLSKENGSTFPPIVSHRDESKAVMTEELQKNAIIVPLRARGHILGTITLARSEPSPRYDKSDLDLAQEFADRVALATDNIRLHETQRYIATTLQESLRPRLVERIPGMEIAVRYAAAGEGIDVGGDFYDVFSYGQKRWAIVIGDVSGRGARAAALTPLIRYTVRAEAMQEREPSRILTVLNDAMLQQSGEDQFCTVAYAKIDPTDDGAHITTVCAGHPSPLVLRANGEVETLGEPGTMLGAVPDIELREHSADLRHADAIILFTDGAIEARRDGENFGEARLIALLGEFAGLGAESIVEGLERSIVEYSQGLLVDDLVLLVAKVTLD